jgi:hypothetical protein
MRSEEDIRPLKERFGDNLVISELPSGAHLVEVHNYPLPVGWNRQTITILFVAPPAFPVGQPDCFWVEPQGFRLAGEGTPQASSDANPIPEMPNRATTWFSWHVQAWNPATDSLVSYFKVIERRLNPPR